MLEKCQSMATLTVREHIKLSLVLAEKFSKEGLDSSGGFSELASLDDLGLDFRIGAEDEEEFLESLKVINNAYKRDSAKQKAKEQQA